MPRQVLTFIVVFGLVFLFMQSCKPKATLPPAVGVERRTPDEGIERIVLSDGAVTLTLAQDGTIVSLKQDEELVIGSVNPSRRTFSTALRLPRGGPVPLRARLWKIGERDETSAVFLLEHESGAVIRKRVALDTEGVTLELDFQGAGEIDGFEFTGPSGVPLAGPDADRESAVFLTLSGRKVRSMRWSSLVAKREQLRVTLLRQLKDDQKVPESPAYYKECRVNLDAGQEIERLGVLGASHYVAVEGFGDSRAFNVDLYRLARDETEARQFEPWISIDLDEQRTAKRKLRLTWGARKDIGAIEPDLVVKEQAATASDYTLENETLRVLLTDKGAAIKAMWLKRYAEVAGTEPEEGTWVPILREVVPAKERALTMQVDAERYGVELDRAVWKTTRQADNRGITFELEKPGGYVFRKTIRLPEQEDEYDLGVEIVVEQPDGSGDPSVTYTLVGPSGVYIEDSYRGIIGAEPPAGLILERKGGESDDQHLDSIKTDEPLFHRYQKGSGLLRAVAIRGAFFVCALVTEERADAGGGFFGDVIDARVLPLKLSQAVERQDGESSKASLRSQISCAVPLEHGVARSHYRFYAGPNERTRLRPLLIEETVDFGMFGFIGRFLMWLMKSLYSILGSWGLAIMLMTLIVRATLMPVSYKTQLGMMRYSKRIQKIKPQLEVLEKKYGKNRQKLNQERMLVMRENKVGFPLGCLMIFFQFPIWIALFAALRVEFALRHESFLWATDLSMPDRLFGLPFWPGEFNILPMLMLALWVIQQKLAPSPGGDDPQVKMQMKMVKFMPYMFFIFLYKYAAALSVYMCVSSAWSIIESKMVRKAIKRADDDENPPGTTVISKSPGKK